MFHTSYPHELQKYITGALTGALKSRPSTDTLRLKQEEIHQLINA